MTAPVPAGDVSGFEGKRVLFLHSSLNVGGAERQSVLLARLLRDRCGADVEMWGFPPVGPLAGICDAASIRWEMVANPWSPIPVLFGARLRAFRKRVSAGRFDILLPYTQVPNIVLNLVWKKTGASCCVWNQRSVSVERVGRRNVALERRAITNASAVICNSRVAAERIRVTYPSITGRLSVVPNGIALNPTRRDRTAWRNSIGIREDQFVACMVANIHQDKDHLTLLRAWKEIIDSHKGRLHPLLLCAGRFDNRYEAAQDLVKDLSIGPFVRFLGAVEDVPGLLGASDIAVLSSREESCPNGVLEPMAAGLPVVGTDVQGIRDAVGSRGLAFLAPPGDHVGMAGRIRTFMEDPGLREEEGLANRRRIEEHFSPDVMCMRTCAVLSGCLRQVP